jgi:hypothetical protein
MPPNTRREWAKLAMAFARRRFIAGAQLGVGRFD